MPHDGPHITPEQAAQEGRSQAQKDREAGFLYEDRDHIMYRARQMYQGRDATNVETLVENFTRAYAQEAGLSSEDKNDGREEMKEMLKS